MVKNQKRLLTFFLFMGLLLIMSISAISIASNELNLNTNTVTSLDEIIPENSQIKEVMNNSGIHEEAMESEDVASEIASVESSTNSTVPPVAPIAEGFSNASAPPVQNTVDNDAWGSSATESGDSAEIYVKEWYPKGRDYVFVCNPNFEAQTYDWDYGDGQKLYDILNQDTYHIFEEDGRYMVSCTAWAPEHLAITWIEVYVNESGDIFTNETYSSEINTEAITFHAELSGINEVPSINDTTSTGHAIVTINDSSISLTGAFINLDSLFDGAHIHFAPVGQSGPVIWPLVAHLAPDNKSGVLSLEGANITQSEIEQFLNGSAYINVHSTEYPSGELRGQFELTNYSYPIVS